jgi:hypothetical protein
MVQNSEAFVAEFEAFSVAVFQHLSISKKIGTLRDSSNFNNGFRHGRRVEWRGKAPRAQWRIPDSG